MALVILPCDLPQWCSLQKYLSSLSTATDAKQFTDGMLKIHNLCNISTGLDPDEPEMADPKIFSQLETFLTNLPNEEKSYFYTKTLPIMARRALNLRSVKPANGFYFSLQQQGDEKTYKRTFLASLLAHSFFSTFPKRNCKTHPTLQDFNFTNFFKHLDQPTQQVKLKSIFNYFELLENVIDDDECVTYSRQVMTGKQWLTINDWVESCLPLCPIAVRSDGSLSEVEPQFFRICFSSSKIGGSVLREGSSQESVDFCTIPELICILASVEALEDNEAFLVKDVYQVSKINHPKQKAILEKFAKPIRVSLCCIDAENYAMLPLSQLEEDNVLRELNKALLGFRQGKAPEPKVKVSSKTGAILRRLSPIGESFSSTPHENNLSKTEVPYSGSPSSGFESTGRRKHWLKPPNSSIRKGGVERDGKGRFIVLGSSGECLPVNRPILSSSRDVPSAESQESTSISQDEYDVFHSARTSLDDEKESLKSDGSLDENGKSPFTSSSEDDIISFTERLREALLRGARKYSSKTDDSSYAVDISLSDSIDEGNNIRCRRGTSTGFILQEDSLDDGLYQESSNREIVHSGNQSDKYSFTTDGSDIDVFDELTKWVKESDGATIDNVTREEFISDFTSTLMKRALSDSYAIADINSQNKNKAVLFARSFSLELAKQNPKLAARLVGLLQKKDVSLKSMLPNKSGQRPVATGNWGCGSCLGGDPQIKLTIQWLAASYTGLPNLIYYTCSHHRLVKLDTVRRVLLDRGWTVGQLTTLLLQYAEKTLQDAHFSSNLFDVLITSIHD
ncbi:hypothetical protein RUM44_003842 [Polyplax serrata]|uniref:poly(ADP-ribose) glycohydrolase n=1 Tax=Polyplax serrata TaxID=468196 RepID=A0ABR1B1W1_POLSC